MSASISFDTLAYAKKLMAAGFTQQQAEVQAEALREIIDDRLATKQDIALLKKDLKELEYRLTIRMMTIIGVAMVLTVSLTVSLVKLL